MADVGNHALVPPVLGQVQQILVGQPCELRRHLVALARRGNEGHLEPAIDQRGDRAFDAAEIVEIDDDLFASAAGDRRDHAGAAGRHLDDLAGELSAVGQHVAAKDRDADALIAAAIYILMHGLTRCFECQVMIKHQGASIRMFEYYSTLG